MQEKPLSAQKAKKEFQIQPYTAGKSEILEIATVDILWEQCYYCQNTRKKKNQCNFSLDKLEGIVDNCVHTGTEAAQAEQSLFHLQGKFWLGMFHEQTDLLFVLCNYPSKQTNWIPKLMAIFQAILWERQKTTNFR